MNFLRPKSAQIYKLSALNRWQL